MTNPENAGKPKRRRSRQVSVRAAAVAMLLWSVMGFAAGLLVADAPDLRTITAAALLAAALWAGFR